MEAAEADGAHARVEDEREAAAEEAAADEAAVEEAQAEEVARAPVRHVSFSAAQAAGMLGLRGKGPKRFRHRKVLR